MSLDTGGERGYVQGEDADGWDFDICGRFVLPPSRTLQQYGVEVQPAETDCFCTSAAANLRIKLSNYI